MSKAPARLPNLYQLLGLAPLESDRQLIVVALKKVQARLKSLRENTQDPKPDEQARVQKLLALGQQLLLDPVGKQQYDLDWQAAFGAPATQPESALATPSATTPSAVLATGANSSTSSTRPSWSMGSLDVLLPEGDPHAAFDLAEYLRSSQVRDPAAAEADLNKLISLLGGEPLPPRSLGTSVATTITSEQLAIADMASGAQATEDQSPIGVTAAPGPDSHKAVATLAQRMRKRQQRSLLLGGAGLVAGVAVLAGMFVYLNRPKRPDQQLAQAPTKPAPAPTKPTPVPGDDANTNLPAVESQAVAADKPAPKPPATTNTGLIQPGQLDKPLQIQASNPPAPQMQPEPAMNMPAVPTPAMPEKTEPPKPAETPASPATTPTPPATPPADSPPADAAKPAAPMTDQPLSESDKRDWLKGMKAVTNWLGKLDTTSAEKELNELKANIKTQRQREQHERLIGVTALVGDARQLIVEAIKNLEAGQELTIKSGKVSFIEGDENHIVIFQNRNTRRFKLDELPAALAEVLIDQNSLDSKLIAAKGAYLMVHPKNSVVEARAKQALEEGAQAGAITPELAKFYEDDYSLP